MGSKSANKSRSSRCTTKSNLVSSSRGAHHDNSILQSPVQICVNGIRDIIKLLQTATPELRNILYYECDLIYECKVCRSLHRQLPNLVTHKREYCKERHWEVPQTVPLEAAATKIRSTTIYLEEADEEEKIDVGVKKIDSTKVTGAAKRKLGLNDVITRITREKQEDVGIQETSQYLSSLEGALASRSSLNTEESIILKKIAGNPNAVFQSVKRQDKLPLPDTENVVKVHHPPPVTTPEKSLVSVIPEKQTVYCERCDKVYPSDRNYKDHVRKVHSSVRLVYPCPLCEQTFVKTAGAIRHLQNIHKKSRNTVMKMKDSIVKNAYKKRVKKREIAPKESDKKEMEQNYRCEYCSRTVSKLAALISHKRHCPQARAVQRGSEFIKLSGEWLVANSLSSPEKMDTSSSSISKLNTSPTKENFAALEVPTKPYTSTPKDVLEKPDAFVPKSVTAKGDNLVLKGSPTNLNVSRPKEVSAKAEVSLSEVSTKKEMHTKAETSQMKEFHVNLTTKVAKEIPRAKENVSVSNIVPAKEVSPKVDTSHTKKKAKVDNPRSKMNTLQSKEISGKLSSSVSKEISPKTLSTSSAKIDKLKDSLDLEMTSSVSSEFQRNKFDEIKMREAVRQKLAKYNCGVERKKTEEAKAKSTKTKTNEKSEPERKEGSHAKRMVIPIVEIPPEKLKDTDSNNALQRLLNQTQNKSLNLPFSKLIEKAGSSEESKSERPVHIHIRKEDESSPDDDTTDQGSVHSDDELPKLTAEKDRELDYSSHDSMSERDQEDYDGYHVHEATMPLLSAPVNVEMEQKWKKYVDLNANECKICGREFTQIHNAKRHVAGHIKWYRYMCNQCDYKAFSRAEVVTHVCRVHLEKGANAGLARDFVQSVEDQSAWYDSNDSAIPLELRSSNAPKKANYFTDFHEALSASLGSSMDGTSSSSPKDFRGTLKILGDMSSSKDLSEGLGINSLSILGEVASKQPKYEEVPTLQKGFSNIASRQGKDIDLFESPGSPTEFHKFASTLGESSSKQQKVYVQKLDKHASVKRNYENAGKMDEIGDNLVFSYPASESEQVSGEENTVYSVLDQNDEDEALSLRMEETDSSGHHSPGYETDVMSYYSFATSAVNSDLSSDGEESPRTFYEQNGVVQNDHSYANHERNISSSSNSTASYERNVRQRGSMPAPRITPSPFAAEDVVETASRIVIPKVVSRGRTGDSAIDKSTRNMRALVEREKLTQNAKSTQSRSSRTSGVNGDTLSTHSSSDSDTPIPIDWDIAAKIRKDLRVMASFGKRHLDEYKQENGSSPELNIREELSNSDPSRGSSFSSSDSESDGRKPGVNSDSESDIRELEMTSDSESEGKHQEFTNDSENERESNVVENKVEDLLASTCQNRPSSPISASLKKRARHPSGEEQSVHNEEQLLKRSRTFPN